MSTTESKDQPIYPPKKLLEEFRDFISRGNVIDLAIGVMMGSALTALVNALVTNLFMPVIGIITGGVNFDSLSVMIFGIALNIGAIITALINFIIIAIILFVMIKTMEKMYRAMDEEKTKTVHRCPDCCKNVDVNATRCPYCTSNITPLAYEVPLG